MKGGTNIEKWIKYFNPRTIFYSILITLFVGLLESFVPEPLDSMLASPFIEEASKFFVLYFFGITAAITYTATFAIIEFSNYMHFMAQQFGYLDIAMITMRAICIGVHFIYLFIQMGGFHLYQEKNLARYIILGYVAAVMLHIMWNSGVGLSIYELIK